MAVKKTKSVEETDVAGSATKATALYHRLKRDIIRNVLAPAQRLRIEVLRERYETGGTPLREALSRLSAEGLVIQEDQRGFVVADINEVDLAELTFTRCQLNKIMVPAALERGDAAWEDRVVLAQFHLSKCAPFTTDGEVNEDYLVRHREFHMSLLAPCGSRWLLDLSEKLFDWTERYQNLALRADFVGSRNVAAEHSELVKAVLSRNANEACRLLDEHVQSTCRLAMKANKSVQPA